MITFLINLTEIVNALDQSFTFRRKASKHRLDKIFLVITYFGSLMIINIHETVFRVICLLKVEHINSGFSALIENDHKKFAIISKSFERNECSRFIEST